MNRQALARTWRPRFFRDLVAQEHVVKALQHALKSKNLHHAYILTGTRGVGKTTVARIFAKALNCDGEEHEEPCGSCPSCQAIDAGHMIDLFEIDAASNTGVDHIREVLENARYAPSASRYKIYIIDEVHMLSRHAFNAMLKTLEEPPGHIKFILATTDPQKIPPTISSRCLQFYFKHLDEQHIIHHLSHILKQEGVSFDPSAVVLLARAARGSMRDALSLTDQALAHGEGDLQQHDVRAMLGWVDQEHIEQLLCALGNKDADQLIRYSRHLSELGVGAEQLLHELTEACQSIAMLHQLKTPMEDMRRWQACQALISLADVHVYHHMLLQAQRDLAYATTPWMGIDMVLLRMLALQSFKTQNPQTNHPSNTITTSVDEPSNHDRQQQHLTHHSHSAVPPESIQKQETTRGNQTFAVMNHEQWCNTVVSISPHLGTARLILQHAVYKSWDEESGVLSLTIAQEHQHLSLSQHVQDIERCLSEYCHRPVHLYIQWRQRHPQEGQQTPLEKQQEHTKKKYESFLHSLQNDTTIEDLKQSFGAEIIEESLQTR